MLLYEGLACAPPDITGICFDGRPSCQMRHQIQTLVVIDKVNVRLKKEGVRRLRQYLLKDDSEASTVLISLLLSLLEPPRAPRLIILCPLSDP